ncbi:MAG: chemotaxis protein CheW [Methanolinea sp. SDB]|nr:MAG: chemotaxis protein CheW [Methanolinea sp. SDB]
MHDVVEFALGKENYALDIEYAREIVEMMPITPIPRAPHYLKGIINLRGEITNILDINQMLGISASTEFGGKKIIILSPEACGGENIGIIVDDVYSVIQIHEADIEHLGDSITELSGYIKGILQVSGRGLTEKKDEKNLLIWIDIYRLLSDLLGE